ncbi:hypothetical protein [Streptomyces sp. TLI_146]|uniref:hypothetical protein n=1 Tax=Streptomyces sp. TLI_146 TaxID=1938858 RepID=UPI000C70E596|nr:hypothetical protein [Streptomyces sp. TLI_146]PKV86336.1 hypothetical protein BX283_3900 [Streptomyces sp. TLI_146]
MSAIKVGPFDRPQLGAWLGVSIPGVIVKDTARGRFGKVIAWDGDARTVTLVPPDGGEPWETDAFRPEGQR